MASVGSSGLASVAAVYNRKQLFAFQGSIYTQMYTHTHTHTHTHTLNYAV